MSRRLVQDTREMDSVKVIQENIKRQKKLRKQRRRRRRLKRLFLFLIVVGLVAAGVWFDQSEYSRVRSIKVSGNAYFNDQEIMDMIDVKVMDRLVMVRTNKLKQALSKQPGIANVSVKVYYTKGIITLTVEENPVVAYEDKNVPVILFGDGYQKEYNGDVESLPLLVGFTQDIINDNPNFADKLSRMLKASYNGISEIHVHPDKLESLYLKLIMNNGFFVFTSVDNLLLMNYYAEIVSGIQSGTQPDNRCIYFLDYGNTPNNQSAISKPCEE